MQVQSVPQDTQSWEWIDVQVMGKGRDGRQKERECVSSRETPHFWKNLNIKQ